MSRSSAGKNTLLMREEKGKTGQSWQEGDSKANKHTLQQ